MPDSRGSTDESDDSWHLRVDWDNVGNRTRPCQCIHSTTSSWSRPSSHYCLINPRKNHPYPSLRVFHPSKFVPPGRWHWHLRHGDVSNPWNRLYSERQWRAEHREDGLVPMWVNTVPLIDRIYIYERQHCLRPTSVFFNIQSGLGSIVRPPISLPSWLIRVDVRILRLLPEHPPSWLIIRQLGRCLVPTSRCVYST